MMVLGRALLGSAGGRWANRTWEDGSSNAQNVEALVDMLRSAATYLLDEVAPLDAPDPPPPLRYNTETEDSSVKAPAIVSIC
jgi:hypothetical protein